LVFEGTIERLTDKIFFTRYSDIYLECREGEISLTT
jgi:hypothetical protein